MTHIGFIGGRLAYHLLRRVGGRAAAEASCSGAAYEGGNKLESLFGLGIWQEVTGKVVLDFGCGIGREAIAIAQHGARRTIGIDMRQKVLDLATRDAQRMGVADRCLFATHTDEKADVIFSIDGFEHYANPEQILRTLRGLIQPKGRVFVSFGPPWLHPLGGHLFSVFPWAHLIFTESALIRWRSDFKSDGATRFGEVEGGLNQMTVGCFARLVTQSDFEIVAFEAIPIKRLKGCFNRFTREFLTSVVRCTLRPRPNRALQDG